MVSDQDVPSLATISENPQLSALAVTCIAAVPVPYGTFYHAGRAGDVALWCESAQGSGSCSNRQHCIERNYKKLVNRGSPSAPIGTPAAADSVIRHTDLLTLLQEVYFDADSQATTSQPRSLLSIARLNIAKSRVRPSTCSLVRIDQTCLGRRGGFAPISFPLFQGIRLSAGSSEFALSCMVVLLGYRGGRACLPCRNALMSAFGDSDDPRNLPRDGAGSD